MDEGVGKQQKEKQTVRSAMKTAEIFYQLQINRKPEQKTNKSAIINLFGKSSETQLQGTDCHLCYIGHIMFE